MSEYERGAEARQEQIINALLAGGHIGDRIAGQIRALPTPPAADADRAALPTVDEMAQAIRVANAKGAGACAEVIHEMLRGGDDE